MASLFVPEDEEYDDKADQILEPQQVADDEEQDLPPIEISDAKTQQYYQTVLEQEQNNIPVVVKETEGFVPIYDLRKICCNLPLRFHQEIADTLLTKDCLLVMGRGLGCEIVTANCLHALSTPTLSLQHGNVVRQKRSLVVLLGAREEEIVKLNDIFMELRWLDKTINGEQEQNANDDDWMSPLRSVSGSELSNTTKRRNTYEKSGVISISSRILVVDLLSGIIRPQDITGIFIMHTERIKETSNESFIVNLFRDGNDWGFVKGISDEPESFVGFTPLATKLKILRFSEVYLWPRFHVDVSQSLLKPKGSQEIVTEISVKLSPKMTKIQSAIMSCLQACLNELRRHNPLIETEYWDMDNVHDEDFVLRVRLSLESQWHRISWTSKQLVSDIGTLKDLLSELFTEDSLTFYQRVQGILDANMRNSNNGIWSSMTMSPWLMMDEATTIISYAKERALGKVTIETREVDVDSNTDAVTSSNVVYNLEELPKWEQLAMVIDDIMHERAMNPLRSTGPILIMCPSHATAKQLAAVFSLMKKRENSVTGNKRFTARSYMVSRLREYLLWKNLTALTKQLSLALDAPAEDEESENEDEKKLNTTRAFTRRRDGPASKRRRTRGALAVANVAKLYSGSTFDRNAGAVDLDESILETIENQLKHESSDESDSNPEETADSIDKSKLYAFEHIDRFDQVAIEVYDESQNESLLLELNPSYIVMTLPQLSFIRRVEIFQAMNPESPAKTFFMYYGTSVEEQSHLTKIRKEKQAFTRLIKEKATLSRHFETEEDNWKFQIRKPQVVNTRIAGGSHFRTEEDEMRVIVDTREFLSQLPNLLYRVGMKVVPCMLTVGDYVLSPQICVERKAIPDLIQSFKSGRLYQQCEQMFRYYETPVLLIEFDEHKSFSFKPFLDLRPPGQKNAQSAATKILNKEIQLKIAELLISFPKLKVIWSSSPYETAQTFLELKANQGEPDVNEALSKGVNASIPTLDGPPALNDDAIDVLQSIPGITSMNYMSVVLKVLNMVEFVNLEKSQLAEMIGQENANKAYNFINNSMM